MLDRRRAAEEAFVQRAMGEVTKHIDAAAQLAEDLGLPQEAKHDLLAAVYEQTLPSFEVAATTSISAIPVSESIASILSWLIEALFPRRPALGVAVLAGDRDRSAVWTARHVDAETGLTLTAQLRGRPDGLSADLDLQLTRADGSPGVDVLVTLRRELDPPRQLKTDDQGRASFKRLLKDRPDRWRLQLQG